MESQTDNQLSTLRTLAFIDLHELEKNVFRGAVLVTDADGKPLEFRCTAAIQPTAVQKTLYGGTLRPHMCIELTAQPLLKGLTAKPDAILVSHNDFIELRPQVKLPLLLVAKQGASIVGQQASDKPAKSKLLASSSGKFDPIVVTCHWKFEEDIRAMLPNLGDLFSRFDLTEPFGRISNALKLVHEKDAVPNKNR